MTLSDEIKKNRPKRRWLLRLMVLLGIAGGGYWASRNNSSKYVIVSAPPEIRIHQGRFFPVGHQTFRARNDAERRAYRSVVLPKGVEIPRGESVFETREDLDRALFRILRDAVDHSLRTSDPDGGADQAEAYLGQMEALTGVSDRQAQSLKDMAKEIDFLEGKRLVRKTSQDLSLAGKHFARARKSGHHEAAEWEARLAAALRVLNASLWQPKRADSTASAADLPLEAERHPPVSTSTSTLAEESVTDAFDLPEWLRP
jgi:hypothetical protein